MAEEAEAPAPPDASFSVEMLGVDGKKTKVPLVTEDLRVARVDGQGPAGGPGGAVTCQLASHYSRTPAVVSSILQAVSGQTSEFFG